MVQVSLTYLRITRIKKSGLPNLFLIKAWRHTETQPVHFSVSFIVVSTIVDKSKGS